MSGDNVVPLFGFLQHDLPVDQVLDLAKKWEMESCLVIGQREDGEIVIGGTTAELKDILWLIMRALWYAQRAEAAIFDA